MDYDKTQEALKLALEPVMSVYITKDGIEDWWHKLPEGRYELGDITAIREALAEQPEDYEELKNQRDRLVERVAYLEEQTAQLIVYRHKNGNAWFRQSAKDPIPDWAVDVQPAQQQKPVATDDSGIYEFWARNKEAEQPAQQEHQDWCASLTQMLTSMPPKPAPCNCKQQEPFGYLWPTGMHPEFRYTQQKRDGVDGMPVYTSSQPAQQQEPVATDWERVARVQDAKLRAMCDEPGGFEKLCEVMDRYERTSPPDTKPWVGLTDEQKLALCKQFPDHLTFNAIEAVEAKLREKNR